MGPARSRAEARACSGRQTPRPGAEERARRGRSSWLKSKMTSTSNSRRRVRERASRASAPQLFSGKLSLIHLPPRARASVLPLSHPIEMMRQTLATTPSQRRLVGSSTGTAGVRRQSLIVVAAAARKTAAPLPKKKTSSQPRPTNPPPPSPPPASTSTSRASPSPWAPSSTARPSAPSSKRTRSGSSSSRRVSV